MPALDESELVLRLSSGRLASATCCGAPGGLAKPRARRSSTAATRRSTPEERGERDARSRPKHQTDGGRLAGERSDGRDGSLVDLLAPAGRDELDARRPQRELARGRPLLLANQAGHARRRRAGTGPRTPRSARDVRVAERLVEADAGRDQAGSGEQPETEWREPRARVQRRLLERAHGRVKRGCAPQQVVGDPADVVD